MTVEELELLFEKHEDEYCKFDRIDNKKSFRPDLHAFLILDRLHPSTRDMVAAAEHDQISLEPELCDVAAIITEDEVVELIRCGVRLDSDYGFCMFV